jgi:Ca-activated chloride channel family protein
MKYSLALAALLSFSIVEQPAPQTQQAQQNVRRAQPAIADPVPFRSPDGKVTGWKVTIPGGRTLATPALANGRVFVGGGFGSHEFYAFDAATGKRLWTYTTGDDGPTAAVVAEGFVAFNTESCEIEVITSEGRRVWKKWLGDPLMSMPAIAGGKVFMAYPNSRGDKKHYVAAFDLRTGREVWMQPIAGEIITAPVIEDGRVFLATLDGTVYSFAADNGATLWTEKKNATSAPAVWNGQTFFSRREETLVTKDGKKMRQQNEMVAAKGVAPAAPVRTLTSTMRLADYLDYDKRASSHMEAASQAHDAAVGFATSKGDGKIEQARRNLGQASVHGVWAYQGSKPFVHGGHLYNSMGDTVQRVDPVSGKVLWKKVLHQTRDGAELRDIALTPPAVVNGKLIVGTTRGEVVALTQATGEVIWKAEIGEPIAFQPAVVKGRVYVTTAKGSLYCLNTGDPADDGWSMWGGTAAHNGLPR